jgi:aryl-alcohol dehydrogenase-like predicted oxidoreductase
MNKRKLGNSGLEVAPLALGGNVFGWTVSDEKAFPILDAFVSAGFNLIDTADIYPRWVPGNQGGESEEIIGNWLKRSGKRKEVIVATKVGMEMGDGKKGLSKDYILRSADDSLRRLQTDYIDLYQSHKDDPETPLEETLEAYDQLIKQGKVRAARLAEALNVSKSNGLARYESLQPLYNLYDRAVYEDELEPLCIEEGIGVINFYSLAAGFLTGKYRSEDDLSKSARGGTVKKYLNERGFGIVEALDQVAAQYNSTPAQIALAWLMARPGITAPIASATSVEQLNDLIEATKLELDQSAIDLLDQASAEQSDKGKSYARTQSS